MPRIRVLASLLLVPLLAVSGSGPAVGAPLDGRAPQVLIETVLVSVEHHRQVGTDLGYFNPGSTLDGLVSSMVRSRIDGARGATLDAIGMIELDTSLVSSPAGVASLGLLNGALTIQGQLLGALDSNSKVKVLARPNLVAINNQVAAIEVLKDHPIVTGTLDGEVSKKEAKAVDQFHESARDFRITLKGIGIDADPLLGIYDGFDGGKKKDILARLGLSGIENLRIRPKKGDLLLQGTQKQPSDASVVISTQLPPSYTVLIPVQLPEKLSKRKRQALENFSFGVEVASDEGSPPAQYAGFEVQTTPDGIAQSSTYANGEIGEVFPIAVPMICTRTAVTTVVTKDGDTVLLGGIFQYENGDRQVKQTKVPILGDLPVLRFFFRNASKDTSLSKKNLMIFVTARITDLTE